MRNLNRQEGSLSLPGLPKDLQLKIFEELNFSSLIAIAGTNRQLRRVIREEYLPLMHSINSIYAIAIQDDISENNLNQCLAQLQENISHHENNLRQLIQYQSTLLHLIEKADLPHHSLRVRFRFLFIYNYLDSFERFMMMGIVNYRTLYLLKFNENLRVNNQIASDEPLSFNSVFWLTMRDHSSSTFFVFSSIIFFTLLRFAVMDHAKESWLHTLQSYIPSFNTMLEMSYLTNGSARIGFRIQLIIAFIVVNMVMEELLNTLDLREGLTHKIALSFAMLQTMFNNRRQAFTPMDSFLPVTYLLLTGFLTVGFITRTFSQLKDMNHGLKSLFERALAHSLQDPASERTAQHNNTQFTGRIDAAIDIVEQSNCSREGAIHALRALQFPRQPNRDTDPTLFRAYQDTRRETQEWVSGLQFPG